MKTLELGRERRGERWGCGLLAVALALASTLSGCGGEDGGAPLRVGFQMHALECQPEVQLEAKLQISGVEGFCALVVEDDRTVSGLCPNVPTGAVRVFRLIYFVTLLGVEVQLASVVQTLDLTGETRRAITLELPADQVATGYDDDGDGMTNLVEVCTNRDPLTPGG